MTAPIIALFAIATNVWGASVPMNSPDAPTDTFGRALKYTLGNEGTATTNDPRDNGGLTRCGITQWMLGRYLGRDATAADLAALTPAQVGDFYRVTFWNPISARAVGVAPEVLIALFDMSVHCGASAAVGLAQRALGLPVDGKLGPQTAAALAACNTERFMRLFVPQAVDRYCRIVTNNPTQLAFLTGWVNRANRLFSLVSDAAIA